MGRIADFKTCCMVRLRRASWIGINQQWRVTEDMAMRSPKHNDPVREPCPWQLDFFAITSVSMR